MALLVFSLAGEGGKRAMRRRCQPSCGRRLSEKGGSVGSILVKIQVLKKDGKEGQWTSGRSGSQASFNKNEKGLKAG